MSMHRESRWLTFALVGAFVTAAALWPSRHAFAAAYQQTDLVSDISGMAAVTDPNLANPWGMSFPPMGPMWVSDNAMGVATLYDGSGQPFPLASPLVVTIPPPSILPPTTMAAPTGNVFNPTTDFGGDRFLFATEDGTISGWSGGTSAVLRVDNTIDPTTNTGPVYKGLALASSGGNNFLYAANFRDARIDVFDKNFTKQSTASFPFSDPGIPGGFAPFDIRSLNGQLYVTYAKQNDVKHDDLKGVGNGFVDIFTTSGVLVKRLITMGPLNSPWGLAIAPGNFGLLSNDLLVGDFGDGLIHAFDPNTGAFLGTLDDAQGNPIAIDGLWGLNFGNGFTAGPTNTLFFTAGINDEKDGLFGTLTTVPEPSALALTGTALLGAALYRRRDRKGLRA